MKHTHTKKTLLEAEYRDDGYDLDDLLHPAHAFEHPSNVVNDPDLTLNESVRSSPLGPPMRVPSQPRRTCGALPGARSQLSSTT
jgi:hypothetical protein